MRIIKVTDLLVGQVLAADVANLHQQVIMPAGEVIDARRRSILKAWGIREVAVEAASEADPASSASEATPEPTGDLLETSDEQARNHPALLELIQVVTRTKAKLGHLVSDPMPAPPGSPAPPAPHALAFPGRSAGLTADKVTAGARALPSLPSVYFQVDRVINHPTSSTSDIAKVLSTDQALCARLLRIANSAFYGFPQRIEGVSEAVRIIGTRQLRDLVLATVVLMQFKGLDARLVNMTSFWRHGLASGIAARAIAASRRESNTERFFVAGLMHDIGSLVLYQVQPALAQLAIERHRTSDMTLDTAERAVIGCHHGAVGAVLMSGWKLPHFFQEVSANHHATDVRGMTPASAAVWLADLLVMALQAGSNGEVRPPRFNAEIWELIGIAPGVLQGVADEVVRLLAETQRMFLGEDA